MQFIPYLFVFHAFEFFDPVNEGIKFTTNLKQKITYIYNSKKNKKF